MRPVNAFLYNNTLEEAMHSVHAILRQTHGKCTAVTRPIHALLNPVLVPTAVRQYLLGMLKWHKYQLYAPSALH